MSRSLKFFLFAILLGLIGIGIRLDSSPGLGFDALIYLFAFIVGIYGLAEKN